MKKVITLVMIAILVLGLCSCKNAQPKPIAESDVTSSVDIFMEGVKEQNPQEIQKIYAGKIVFPDTMDDVGFEECSKQLYEKIFDFDYYIISENVSGNEATVEIEINTYEFAEVLIEWMNQVLYDATIFENLNGEEQIVKKAEIYLNILNEYTAEKNYSQIIELNLVKDGDVWVIKDSECIDKFVSAIYGGLIQE